MPRSAGRSGRTSSTARVSAVLLGAVTIIMLGAVVIVFAPAGASAPGSSAAGRYQTNEPALALARPATMYLQVVYTGVVRDRADGAPITAEPVVHRRRCSATMINPAGCAVTTSTCAVPTPEVLLINALNEVARLQVSRGLLAVDQISTFVAERLRTTEFTGTPRSRRPAVTLAVWPDGFREGGNIPGVSAEISFAQPAENGNVAVVKIDKAGLPAVELTDPDPIAPGHTVVLTGFTSADTSSGPIYEQRSRVTTVIGRSGTNRWRTEAGIGPQSRGGAVVDTSGRLLAIQDVDNTLPGEPVHDLVLSSHIRRALLSARVDNSIGATGLAYRAALTEYFAGRYTTAVTRFDTVLDTEPAHAAARRYRDLARARRDLDGDAVPDKADWRGYARSAGAGVAAVFVLQLATFAATRRRALRFRSPRPSDPDQRDGESGTPRTVDEPSGNSNTAVE